TATRGHAVRLRARSPRDRSAVALRWQGDVGHPRGRLVQGQSAGHGYRDRVPFRRRQATDGGYRGAADAPRAGGSPDDATARQLTLRWLLRPPTPNPRAEPDLRLGS